MIRNFILIAFIFLFSFSCSKKEVELGDAGLDVSDADGNSDVDADTDVDGDSDTDSDSDTDGDSDAGDDSGTDAGEECEEHLEGDKCIEGLECFCESRPDVCKDTLEKARIRAENDEPDDAGWNRYKVCLSLCTNGDAFIEATDYTHGSIRYFGHPGGELIGAYIGTDIPVYCLEGDDRRGKYEKYAGNTNECQVKCQVGVDCNEGYPECD